MRQLWFSVAILAGMILLLNWNGVYLEKITQPVRQEIAWAAEAVQAGEWEQADAHVQKAKKQWQAHGDYLRYVQCHADLEEVSVLLEESEAFLSTRETGAYLSRSAKLLGAMDELCELERLSLGNLF